jgi:ketosteroid isomerase-like protein
MTTTTTITPPAADAATTVRSFFAAWEAGDVSELSTLVDARVVLGPILGLLYERAVYTGRAGVAQAFAETAVRWHALEIDVQATRTDDGALIADLNLSFEKHGMTCDIPVTVACRLADGRVVSVEDA